MSEANQTSSATQESNSQGQSQTSQQQGLPTLGENWYQQLPEDIRDEAALKTIHDLPSLAKSFVHAQKAVGMDKVVLPSKHATEQDWKQFWNKVGLPEKFEEYKVDPPKDAEINTEFFGSVKKKMHELGFLPKQASELLNWYVGEEKKMLEARVEQGKSMMEEHKNTLKKEWGKAYDQNIERAKQAVKFLADPDLTKFLDETGAGSQPSVVKAFAKFAELLKEDAVHGLKSQSVRKPTDAQVEIGTIMANMEHPYHNTSHPNHRAAVKEMSDLYSEAYPDQDQ